MEDLPKCEGETVAESSPENLRGFLLTLVCWAVGPLRGDINGEVEVGDRTYWELVCEKTWIGLGGLQSHLRMDSGLWNSTLISAQALTSPDCSPTE